MSLPSGPSIVAKKRIVVLDSQPLVRHGLAALLNAQEDLICIGITDEVSAAVEMVDRDKADLAIIDTKLANGSWLSFVKQTRALPQPLPILVCSSEDDLAMAERSVRVGCRGYLTKHASCETVLKAIRRIVAGNVFFSELVQNLLASKIARGREADELIDSLSARELEIFGLIGEGVRTSEIAARLKISVKTIESHRAHIKKKLCVPDGARLAALAAKLAYTRAAA